MAGAGAERKPDDARRAPKVRVGWNEFVDLPDWGIRRLGAKVDTGARSSALHVEDLERISRDRVRFRVVVHREHRDRHVPVVAPISRRSRVKSSNGEFDLRYFVRTRLRLGPVEKEIEISLVDRGRMIHRMLLGRTALAGDFVVDVSRRHLQDRAAAKPKKKKARSAAAGRPKKARRESG